MEFEKALVIDDDPSVLSFLAEALRRRGMEVMAVASGQEAIAFLPERSFDLVITDMKIPPITGLEIVRACRAMENPPLVLVITGHGSIGNAVEAIRAGAFDYVEKPFSLDSLFAILEKGKEYISLVRENAYLRSELRDSHIPRTLIAESPAMKRVIEEVKQVADSRAAVFVQGETGTGKEVISNLIHALSPRRDHPLVRINCAAIPEHLVESELFGHEKGAFTGAIQKRTGRFELAHQGTLLLDELTEIPFGIQAKLLRAVQELEFERVGGNKTIHVDVRFISTSNRNLQEALEKHVLRRDLYYRLSVIPILIPPLRERQQDILPLAEYFLNEKCRDNRCATKQLTRSARKSLEEYSWPGNVRELANLIERAVVLHRDKTALDRKDLGLDP